MPRDRDDQDQLDHDLDGNDHDSVDEAVGGTNHAGCSCRDAGFPLLRTLVKDDREVLAINLMRHVLFGLWRKQLPIWDHAFAVAEAVMGPVEAPVLVGRVIALGRALREDRRGNFRFLPINCPYISEDEADLLTVIQAGRSGEALHALAVRLTRNGDPRHLMHAASLLGVALGGAATAASVVQPSAVWSSAVSESRH